MEIAVPGTPGPAEIPAPRHARDDTPAHPAQAASGQGFWIDCSRALASGRPSGLR